MKWWQNPGLYRWHQGGGLGLLPLIVVLVVAWSVVWKGVALYRAARNEQKVWFVILLVVNTVGILEIIYLLFFSKPSLDKKL